MPKLEEELRHFPYGTWSHNYDYDSLSELKETAARYLNDTHNKLSTYKDSITTEEGYNIRCNIVDIADLEWRLEKFNLNDDDKTYLYLKDSGCVFEKVSRVKEILMKMKDRFIKLNEKRYKYLRDVEMCTDKKKLLEMDIDW